MKILLPFKIHNNVSIHDDRVAGGVENFIKSIYQNVVDHEVIPLEYSIQDTSSGLILHKIITEIAIQGIDLIVINYESSLLKKLPDLIDIPIMWICHNKGNLIAKKPYVQMLPEFIERNSAYMVSEYQFESWYQFGERLNMDLQIDGFINSAFDNSGNVYQKEKIYDIIIISRTNAYKDPYWLNKKLIDYDKPVKVLFVTTEPSDRNDIEYQNLHTSGKIVYEVKKNLPYSEVMNCLQQSKVLFSPLATETFGIVGIEAICRGVPILAASERGTCSLLSILGPEHVKCVTKGEKIESIMDKAYELMDYTTDDRIELQKEYKDKFSKKQWLEKLNESFLKSVEKYNMTKIKKGKLTDIFDF